MSMILQLGHIGSSLEEALSISIRLVCARTGRTSTLARRSVGNLQSPPGSPRTGFTDPPCGWGARPRGRLNRSRRSLPAPVRFVNGLQPRSALA